MDFAEDCALLFTSPEGRGRREAPGEGLRSIDGAEPLTRIAKAIRPLPAGKVNIAVSSARVGRRPVNEDYRRTRVVDAPYDFLFTFQTANFQTAKIYK